MIWEPSGPATAVNHPCSSSSCHVNLFFLVASISRWMTCNWYSCLIKVCLSRFFGFSAEIHERVHGGCLRVPRARSSPVSFLTVAGRVKKDVPLFVLSSCVVVSIPRWIKRNQCARLQMDQSRFWIWNKSEFNSVHTSFENLHFNVVEIDRAQ